MNQQLYLLKIQLLDIEPAIWRCFVVPANITLDRLHDVIQIVMGWEDCHLYKFTIGKKRYTGSPDFEEYEDGLNCSEYHLNDLIKKKGSKFRYLYDFGDSWDHELIIENSRFDSEMGQGAKLLACLEGERACPPEDVGGFPGYFQFCEVLNDPNHEEHESYMEWVGGEYDSESFDVEAVNLELMRYLR